MEQKGEKGVVPKAGFDLGLIQQFNTDTSFTRFLT
jgi:hypothetical protein